MIKALKLMQTNRPLDVLLSWRDDPDGLLLNPPYQRGDVWGVKRRVNFIRSLLMGVPIPSLIINSRLNAEWHNDYRIAVIDGKQRITSILMFVDGQLPVPGIWFDSEAIAITYTELTKVSQRKFKNLAMPFSEGILPTIEDEQMVFDLVNFGGLTQGETDSD